MAKKVCLIFSIIFVLFLVPLRSTALEVSVEKKSMKSAEIHRLAQNCNDDDSILGNVNDENSVAWLLQQVFNFIKVIGPLLVVVLSSVDFAKVIINSDDEAMTQASKKLMRRLILAAALFFIPTLVQAILDVFGFTSDATCGIQ